MSQEKIDSDDDISLDDEIYIEYLTTHPDNVLLALLCYWRYKEGKANIKKTLQVGSNIANVSDEDIRKVLGKQGLRGAYQLQGREIFIKMQKDFGKLGVNEKKFESVISGLLDKPADANDGLFSKDSLKRIKERVLTGSLVKIVLLILGAVGTMIAVYFGWIDKPE